ncbi:MAG: aldehyde ferredoxin oxidoreductase family protein [Candidatus Bipolaricaulota bacterium]|nr:aldehyde ferredoxin oxidoreductase family protein [Candidatus Bipolaricaulota bacterium]
MTGVFGRYLDVDLGSGRVGEREVPERLYALHLGGRGIGARLLLELVPPGTDAFAPENALVWATGPLQGTGVAGAGRHAVLAVSPKTGAIADSYVGGYLGHELGRSGYDGIIVRGQAARPVYLLLAGGKAELRDATDLWGKTTGEVDEVLRRRHPGVRVAAIGPAGERLVVQACIVHDRSRAAGRPGLGAVMGAKRLKAVAVAGQADKPLARPKEFARARALFAQELMDEGMKRFGEFGTARGLTWLSEMGILPTKNFQDGVFDGASEIGGERLAQTILVDRETCAGCPVRCKRVVQTEFSGRKVHPEYGGPEYETLAALGSLCLVSDLNAIALANELCNAYGLDTISVGVAIAALMEASEKGLLPERVAWGDGRAVVEWTEKIARREGLGDELASGLEAWARKMGIEFAMTVKGVEVPMHEPRGKVALGLSYALSPRGATHLEGLHDTMLEQENPSPELGIRRRMDRFALADKARVLVVYENLRSYVNSLVLCAFVTRDTGPRYNHGRIRELVGHATGLDLTPKDMLRIGERNFALLRLFAARAGMGPERDGLPLRFHEPLPRGASAGRPIGEAGFAREMALYRRIRGWTKDGISRAKLRALDLEDLGA